MKTKRRTRNLGRAIAIGTIILAFFVAIMFILLFNNWLSNDNTKIATESKTEIEILEEIHKTNFYENGYDRKIVAQIVEEDVPIPAGFEFVSGTKETGLIIKDKNTNSELMWIPYDEDAKVEGIEEYYKNANYKQIDSTTLDSIEKYGGFYITLEEQNQYEILKQVDDASYQKAVADANKLYENSKTVNSDLISLTELQQVLSFANKNGINVTQTSLENNAKLTVGGKAVVTKTATENKKLGLVSVKVEKASVVENQDKQYNDKYVAQKVRVTVENEVKYVPIPQGYDYYSVNYKNNSNNSIVKIQDENLVYIWVPVNETEGASSLSNAKAELNKLYENYSIVNNWQNATDPTDTDEYKTMKASVEKYGGFYISEAELGYGDDGELYNKARGMENSLVNKGEYFRTIEDATRNKEVAENFNKYKIDKDEKGYYLTYEKANELASKASRGKVVSHLTYGAEWDATMLWIMKTNKKIEIKDVIESSIYIQGAKYKYPGDVDGIKNEGGKDRLFNIKDDEIQRINGIYGLAGNLLDLTQESMEENGVNYKILRGGSFGTLGKEFPMASRARLDNLRSNDVGFRNCLYILSNDLKIEETEATETTEATTASKWSGNVADSFAGGAGTESDPYKIATGEQLAYLAKIVNEGNTCEGKYFAITNNIDLDNKKWTPIGKYNRTEYIEEGISLESVQSLAFSGVFDGASHTIYGLNVNVGEDAYAGLFGYVALKGEIKNVTIGSGNIIGRDKCGGIAGAIRDEAKVINCTNKARVQANVVDAGGIVGVIDGAYNENFDIIDYEYNASLPIDWNTASWDTIKKYMPKNETIIQACVNEGEVVVGYDNAWGGFSQGTRGGGIVGTALFWGGQDQNSFKIINCVNKGKVRGSAQLGGIVGYAQNEGIVQGCKHEGTMEAVESPAGESEAYRGDVGDYYGIKGDSVKFID